MTAVQQLPRLDLARLIKLPLCLTGSIPRLPVVAAGKEQIRCAEVRDAFEDTRDERSVRESMRISILGVRKCDRGLLLVATSSSRRRAKLGMPLRMLARFSTGARLDTFRIHRALD
jgi:hypothetical protein